MRLRLTTFAAILIALAMVAASPASAATSITRVKVVSSLLSAGQIGSGWHRYVDSSPDADPRVIGCKSASYKSVGERFEATRSFENSQTFSVINQSVASFKTRAAARTDFTKGVRLLSACSLFALDGRVFHITRVSAPDLGDQAARFRLTGTIATAAAGVLKVTILVVATRYGRQQTMVLVIDIGPKSAAAQRDFSNSTARVARTANAKVATVLGR
jgi:hypothetical protein